MAMPVLSEFFYTVCCETQRLVVGAFQLAVPVTFYDIAKFPDLCVILQATVYR